MYFMLFRFILFYPFTDSFIRALIFSCHCFYYLQSFHWHLKRRLRIGAPHRLNILNLSLFLNCVNIPTGQRFVTVSSHRSFSKLPPRHSRALMINKALEILEPPCVTTKSSMRVMSLLYHVSCAAFGPPFSSSSGNLAYFLNAWAINWFSKHGRYA